MFYVVSPLKMMVLFLSTLGGYALYWHYKNWRMFKNSSAAGGSSIWPAPRALFSVFFTHALMRKVEAHASAAGREIGVSGTVATVMVLLTVLSWLFSFVPDSSEYFILATVFGIVMVVPLMFVYRAAQVLINASCGDVSGQSNSTFTAANVIWILIGAVLWFAIIASLLYPEAAA
jgi:hypothetical protein